MTKNKNRTYVIIDINDKVSAIQTTHDLEEYMNKEYEKDTNGSLDEVVYIFALDTNLDFTINPTPKFRLGK